MRQALAVAAAAGAFAGPAGASVSFSQADPNHDGYVDWAEAQKAFPLLKKIHFQKCDANGDGKIDQAEFPLLSNFYWINYIERQ
ncbi:MAG: hypothetical protein U1E40_04065 [Amaricoccus sp.]